MTSATLAAIAASVMMRFIDSSIREANGDLGLAHRASRRAGAECRRTDVGRPGREDVFPVRHVEHLGDELDAPAGRQRNRLAPPEIERVELVGAEGWRD